MNTAEYWDSYYRSRSGAIDWYCGPENPVFVPTVNRVLDDHAKHRAQQEVDERAAHKEQIEVLHVGCGTSDFVSYLDYSPLGGESACQQQLQVVLHHIDFVRVCIDTLQEAIAERDLEHMSGHGMQCIHHRFHVMDCGDLEAWTDGSVDLVVDKGTIDTILSTKETLYAESHEQRKQLEFTRLLREWERVLVVGGAIVVVSIRNPYCVLKYAGMDKMTTSETCWHTRLSCRQKLPDFNLVTKIYRVAASPLEDPSRDCIWVITFTKC
eukprot:gb/GECG01008884.1/.p1 GENE.gb/GECG01008884.1/~~gb/GECG01008884.1/.p1  ORF type:complete len:267 (+),score=19.86 gb/GECG01008884.1/:1-801(+)